MKNSARSKSKAVPDTGVAVRKASVAGIKRGATTSAKGSHAFRASIETAAEPVLEVTRIGRQLRTLRQSQGLTLVDLAAKVKCSPSLVSRVENGLLMPSLSNLHRLVAGLGTTMASFLSGSETESCTVVRGSDRREVALEYLGLPKQGVRIEQIIPHSPDRRLQGNLITISAGHGSAGEYSHTGEEAGFIIEGFIKLTINKQTHVLGKGDSFCFPSEAPHSFFNPGPAEAVVVWINTPPTF